MRYSGVIVTEPDPAIERNRPEPDPPSFLPIVQHLPEPNMMTAVGTFADGLFKSQVLTTVLIVERAHWCVAIWSIEQDATNDLNARSQCDRVSRVPAGFIHCTQHVISCANYSHIDWVAGNADF